MICISRSVVQVRLVGGLALGALLLAGCGARPFTARQSAQGVQLRGASSSFAAMAYWRWFNGLAVRQDISADLAVMGSGDSIRRFLANQVDFAGTDSAPTPMEIRAARRGLLAFPVTAGAIAVAYNLPGCDLRLTRQQLVQVLLGRIRDFAELGCSAQPITLLHRMDPSGSTANLTATLAAISPLWKQGPGAGRLVRWPQGEGVSSSDAMAERLLATRGGIGYIEAAYVRAPLRAAALQNRSGDFVRPDPAAVAAALLQIPLDERLLGANPDPRRGYPIVSMNWLLVPAHGLAQRAEAMRISLRYILSQSGQDDAELLGYAPLPQSIRAAGMRQIAKIRP